MNALARFARAVDRFNDTTGRYVAWLAVVMVLVQFIVVMMRYVYGIGSISMQESIVYMHGILFLVGSGYTLLHNGHVRVDIFYRDARAVTKAWVDLVGSLALLLPVCLLIWYVSYPYVANSWAALEGSRETSGIQAVFLLKTVILVFCALMIAQGLSMAAHSMLVITGREEPPEPEHFEEF